MSIKSFHILFIVASTLLSAGMAFWGFANGTMPIFSWSFAVATVALPVYGKFFLTKTRNIIL
jgi:hypothetical protein